MELLLNMTGGLEWVMIPGVMLIGAFIIYTGIKLYFNNRSMKKELDSVTAERDRLRDSLVP